MWRWVAVGAVVVLGSAAGAQSARDAAPANTSPPTISGTAREGETLTAASGSWSGSTPMTFSYKWQRCKSDGGGCGSVSGGSNQSYKLTHSDVGHTMRVSVTAKNGEGSGNALSGPTAVVAQGLQPVNTALPTIGGTAKEGATLSASNGSWQNGPTSFSYQWLRCNTGGGGCGKVGDNRSTYRLDSHDVGSTMRVQVRAKNAYGSNPATSAQTAVVAPSSLKPVNTAPPTITGSAQDGQTLAAHTGAWTNSPTKYAFRWLRCDGVGNNCNTAIGGGTAQRLTSADVGHTIRLTVWASNQYGTSAGATSVPTGVVTSALPAGGIKLPSGEISLPVQQVSLPQQLVISGVSFIPSRLRSRQAFVGRFRVTDTRGYVIRGALVYAIGLPYAWIRPAAETITGTDGWAQITFLPTSSMPLRRSAVVFFVRTRKPGEKLLSGVANRRLVQVRIG